MTVKHKIEFDYSIDSSDSRAEFIKRIYGDILSELRSSELEAIANYILYPSQSKLTERDELTLMEEVDYAAKKISKNLIQKKNAAIDFKHPELQQLKESIDKIKQLEEKASDAVEKKKLKKWRAELVGDAHLFPGQDEGLFFEVNRTNHSNSYAPTVAEEVVDEKFDFSNYLHLRAFLVEYDNIAKSYNMKPMLEFFDRLYYDTPMRPWERTLMELWKERTEYSNLEIQQILYHKHGRVINQPNYLNQVVVRVCKSMVDTYYLVISERHFAEDRGKWRFCSSCGKWKLNTIGAWKQTGSVKACEVCRLGESIEVNKYSITEHPFPSEEKRKQPLFKVKEK